MTTKPFPKVFQTVLTFDQDIPPDRNNVEVRCSSVRIERDGKWAEVPVAEVGIFKTTKLITDCTELTVVQVEIEVTPTSAGGSTQPGMHRQFPGGQGIPVEVWHRNAFMGDVRWDVCFPEHITFFVANRTGEARRFIVEVYGVSRPDWTKR